MHATIAAGAVILATSAVSPRLLGSTIQDALDGPGLVFTTGGTDGIGWTYEPQNALYGDNTFDGVDSARAGRVPDLGESWIQTEVVGPGTVSFWWQAFSEPYCDLLSFHIGESLVDSISGTPPGWPSGWLYRVYNIPAGTNSLRWVYSKDFEFTGGTSDTAWLDKVTFRQIPPPSVAEALGLPGFEWTSGGNDNVTEWFAQAEVVYDGSMAVQSGDVFHDQASWLQTTIGGITNLSFWWKVSSETNCDFLEFHTNDVLAARISGEENWQPNFFRFAANTTNTIRWTYRKDNSITDGANCGWVDRVIFAPGPVPTSADPFQLGPATILPDGRFQLSIVGAPGASCRIMVTTNFVNWAELSTVVATGAVTHVIDSNAPGSPARFYRAVTP